MLLLPTGPLLGVAAQVGDAVVFVADDVAALRRLTACIFEDPLRDGTSPSIDCRKSGMRVRYDCLLYTSRCV